VRTAINPVSVLLVLLAANPPMLAGQEQLKVSSPGDLQTVETKEDDARWWTLTDEITPHQLRAIHEDVELHRERYQEGVKAGTRDPLPRGIEGPSFFIDGTTHPELFQMCSVFDAFAIGFGLQEADPRASLVKFGFEGEVLETIIQFTNDYWRERQVLTEKLSEEMQPVLEFVLLGREKLGEENFKAAYKTRNATMLASVTGYSVEQVEKAFDLMNQAPMGDFSAQALPLLKQLLAPADWNRFRAYLLEVQAPMMSSVSTDVLGEN